MTTTRRSATEERLLDLARHHHRKEVVAVGLVEVRAAQRFVDWGWASIVRDGGADLNGTTTSLTIRLDKQQASR